MFELSSAMAACLFLKYLNTAIILLTFDCCIFCKFLASIMQFVITYSAHKTVSIIETIRSEQQKLVELERRTQQEEDEWTDEDEPVTRKPNENADKIHDESGEGRIKKNGRGT